MTSSLAIDYLGRATLGEWLEINTVLTHAGKSQGVAQCFVTADGRVIARANATFGF